MFRLIRLPILLVIAFVLGMFWEKQQNSEACIERGGTMSEGLCVGAKR